MRLDIFEEYDPQVRQDEMVYRVNNGIRFEPLDVFDQKIVEKVFNFAYGMSFGHKGVHRDHRTGGIIRRKKGEIFADAFQGKIAEFALWNLLNDNGIQLEAPDTKMHGEGVWDSYDFIYGDIKIAVKSTKSFGQLILLEQKDWNEEGLYTPNSNTQNERYDYFVLIRLRPYASNILMDNRLLYSNTCNHEQLRELIMEQKFSYDIPGYMTRNDLIQLIRENYFIPQGAYLNRIGKNNRMDADNYYLQAGNLHHIDNLVQILRQI